MQNFDSSNRDALTSDEAREVLQAWANRREASGVDASVNSIPALAAGLGVSEEEVRRIVEDLRVQQRSHQIAAGILSHENARRKSLDVTAAIGAAIAFIVLALLVGAFFVMRSKTMGPAEPAVIVDGVPTPPLPPVALPGEPRHMTIQSDDGSSIVIDGSNIRIKSSDGEVLQVAGGAARAEMMKQIAECEKQKAEIMKSSAGRSLTTEESLRMRMLDAQIKALQKNVDKLKKQSPPGTTVTP